MPKKSKLVDPNNVRNPFAQKISIKVENDLTSGKRKGKPITEEPDLPTATEDETNDLADSTQSFIVIKEEPNFNLYAGTDLGLLKGISIGKDLPIAKSIFTPENLKEKPPCVSVLSWVDDTEKELLVCFSNHVVKTYNTKLRCFSRQIELDVESASPQVVGLCCHNSGNYVFGLENGQVSMYNCLDSKTTLSFNTCKEGHMGDLRKLRQCPTDKSFYATGGNENDLKVWNLGSETPDKPFFKARNVPHDNLDLRVPVWVQDLTFLPRTTEVVAVATRYGQIRLYDVRASERPVSNVQFADHAIMSMTSTMHDRQVVVGTAKGEAGLFDLRHPGHEKLCLKYIGFSGSIRSMVTCPDQPYVVSSGLDRHLYIHKLTQKEPFKKLYLKQQINCIALSKTFMKDSKPGSATEGDWANIPSEVLNVNAPPTSSEVSPIKKPRTSIHSLS